MRVFVVRPFGTKPFGAKQQIDFDRVHALLIRPALDRLGLGGGTTGEFSQAGNIREDMFQLLVTADLVIADISIHNANVYYELGIRHAARDRRTFMIRCRGDEVPFDLHTDRYLEYDRDDPATCIDALVKGLKATIDSPDPDSPVYKLLPDFKPPRFEHLLVVPSGFYDEVAIAAQHRRPGKLRLLSEELQGFQFRWSIPGLRAIGHAQMDLKQFGAAGETWGAVCQELPDDADANAQLATAYQKQRPSDLAASDAAVTRALARVDLTDKQKAELLALRGSNAKRQWRAEWQERPAGERPAAALRSAWLGKARADYQAAFSADFNHFYSGLNTLQLVAVTEALADQQPQVWVEPFETDEDAARALQGLRQEHEELQGAVNLALRGRTDAGDIWRAISRADVACVTSEKPARVAALYRTAVVDAKRAHVDAALEQLEMYAQLGVFPAATQAATAVLEERRRALQPETPAVKRALLFSGHRIDEPGQRPRFPATPEAEATARRMILDAIQTELAAWGVIPVEVVGYAGGANGGDILFHEVCADLGIHTFVMLAGARDTFAAASVAPGGPSWMARFERLCAAREVRFLNGVPTPIELPAWLSSVESYSIWERNNSWLLYTALDHGAANVAVLALWDGLGGHGPGGTQHMFDHAQKEGARVVRLPAERLLASPA